MKICTIHSGQKCEVSLETLLPLFPSFICGALIESLYFLFAAIDRGIYLARGYLFSRVIDTAENAIGHREETEFHNRIHFTFPHDGDI